jgi:hypothetical protein
VRGRDKAPVKQRYPPFSAASECIQGSHQLVPHLSATVVGEAERQRVWSLWSTNCGESSSYHPDNPQVQCTNTSAPPPRSFQNFILFAKCLPPPLPQRLNGSVSFPIRREHASVVSLPVPDTLRVLGPLLTAGF